MALMHQVTGNAIHVIFEKHQIYLTLCFVSQFFKYTLQTSTLVACLWSLKSARYMLNPVFWKQWKSVLPWATASTTTRAATRENFMAEEEQKPTWGTTDELWSVSVFHQLYEHWTEKGALKKSRRGRTFTWWGSYWCLLSGSPRFL